MKQSFSVIGIAVGAIALMAAVLHFFAGPIERQRPLEQIVAEKASSLREAVRSGLKGQPQDQRQRPDDRRLGADRMLQIATAGLGALAMILGVVGFARREDRRMCASAVTLGVGAIAFQFAIIALGAVLIVALIGAVIANLGLG